MDDLDRELKRIRIMRERLALDRELERRNWKANTIGAAKRTIQRAVKVVRELLGVIVGVGRRWWKLAAFMIAGVAMGGTLLKEAKERARLPDVRVALSSTAASSASTQAGMPETVRYTAPLGAHSDAGASASAPQALIVAVDDSRAAASTDSQTIPDVPVPSASVASASADVVLPVIYQYVVQVGAYTDSDTLLRVRQSVERAGFKAYIQRVETEAGIRSRVRIGPFPSRTEADVAAHTLGRTGLTSNVLVFDSASWMK